MKKDFLKRALCLICCFSLTLGAFAYRPPKAEAFALSGPILFGLAIGAVALLGTTLYYGSDGDEELLADGVRGLYNDYCAESGAASNGDRFATFIADGVRIDQAGAIVMSAAAGAATAGFINWYQDKYYSASVTRTFAADRTFVDGRGKTVCFSTYDNVTKERVHGTTTYRFDDTPLSGTTDSIIPDGGLYTVNGIEICPRVYQTSTVSDDYETYPVKFGLNRPNGSGATTLKVSGSWYDSSGNALTDEYIENNCTWSPTRYHRTDATTGEVQDYFGFMIYNEKDEQIGSWMGTSDSWLWSDIVTVTNERVLTVTTRAEPIKIPAVEQQQVLVFDVGTNNYANTTQDAAGTGYLTDSIAGTNDVTITVEDATVWDTATDIGATADLLDATKAIAQNVLELPRAIADEFVGTITGALESAFALDATLANQISNTFNNKFGFLPTIYQVGQDLLNMDENTTPPVIYIHLQNAEGRFVYGGTEKALDMAFYQRYKVDGDRIISGFLWLGFLWMVFKRASAIIQGGEMVTAPSGDGGADK